MTGLRRCTTRYCGSSRRIMEIGEAVCVKSGSRKVIEGAVKKDEEGAEFEMMANIVWSEIGRALMDELGSVIFAAGKPDEFRKVSGHSYVRAKVQRPTRVVCSITKQRRRSYVRSNSLHPQCSP